MENILSEVKGGYTRNGRYAITVRFADSVDPGIYRARMFLYVEGTNDLSSSTGTGMYAIPGNPGDTISYDDWNSIFRPKYRFASGSSHDPSFNVETVWGFSGDSTEHVLEFCDSTGKPVHVSGESYINGVYDDSNLPVNFLVERRIAEIQVERITYATGTGKVTVVTSSPHGFVDGDAITVSGLPSPVHSMGVNGERYNGTFRITVDDPSTFSYATMFYPGFTGQNNEYVGCDGATASKWVAVEYRTDREVLCSLEEAIVVWPGHTLVAGDRITLCDGSTAVVTNAVVESPAPNALVCRSSGLVLGTQADSIVYAPRTPIWEIPVNYTVPVQEEPVKRTRSLEKASRGVSDSFPSNMVTNGSNLRAAETSVQVAPSVLAGFDLSGQPAGVSGTMAIGTGKFIAIRFNPSFGLDALEGNSFEIEFRVTASTEVSTEVCMYSMTGNSWSADTDATRVYSMISRVSLGNVVIETEDGTCDYTNTARVFSIQVSKNIADSWVSRGEPVSLALVLYERDGAVVTVDRDSFSVTRSVNDGTGGEVVPLPVKVEPSLVTPGDTVTVYSLNTGKFSSNAGNLRVKLGNDGNPDSWVNVMSSAGDSLTFIMPEGHDGRGVITVMQKISGNWVDASEPVMLESYTKVNGVMKLNDRMRPGEIDGTVSYSATYNRDLAFNGFAEITDENSMIQNLYSCLLTRRGERLFNREFGTSLEEMVFSLRDTRGDNAIMKECLDAISTYEPRITLIYEQCRVEDMGPHGVRLVLGVEVPGGTVHTISIPFKYRGRVV